MASQEEEVLGKAYDSRLMRRLLTYLRPYKWHVVVALIAIVVKSVADVLGPFLTKIVIDKYMSKSTNASIATLESALTTSPWTVKSPLPDPIVPVNVPIVPM